MCVYKYVSVPANVSVMCACECVSVLIARVCVLPALERVCVCVLPMLERVCVCVCTLTVPIDPHRALSNPSMRRLRDTLRSLVAGF